MRSRQRIDAGSAGPAAGRDLDGDGVDVLAQVDARREQFAGEAPSALRAARSHSASAGRSILACCGPVDDVLGRTQMFLMGRPAAARRRVGEIEREFAANQRQRAGAGSGRLRTD